jgi:hypothetical protein
MADQFKSCSSGATTSASLKREINREKIIYRKENRREVAPLIQPI